MKSRLIDIIIASLMAALMVLASACNIEDDPKPGPEPGEETPSQPAEVDRTVLVYMVAANSLGRPGSYGEYDLKDLDEMRRAAAEGKITNGRLLVYHVPYTGTPNLVEVTPQGLDTLVRYNNNVLSIAGERMKAVFDDMRLVAPARDYGLILWSHASGWLENGMDEPEDIGGPEPLSFGDHGGKRMNITTLARTLKDQGFSFVYFDCCNMANVEVAYELRRSVPLMAASVTELPGPGMPYHLTVPYFFAPDAADVVGAAQATYDVYHQGKDHPGYDYFTISVTDLTAMDRVAQAVRSYYELMTCGFPSRRPQRFSSNNYYYDLQDYLSALRDDALRRTDVDDPDFFLKVEETYRAACQAIEDAVVYKAALPQFNNIRINTHCGLSTYILTDPSASSLMKYNQLQWFSDVAGMLIM